MLSQQNYRVMGINLTPQRFITLSWIAASMISFAIQPMIFTALSDYGFVSLGSPQVKEVITRVLLSVLMNSVSGLIVGFSVEKICLFYQQDLFFSIRNGWILAFVLQGICNVIFYLFMNWLFPFLGYFSALLNITAIIEFLTFIEAFISISLCCTVGVFFTIGALNTPHLSGLYWFAPLSCWMGLVASTLTGSLLVIFDPIVFQFYDEASSIIQTIIFGATVGMLISWKLMTLLPSVASLPVEQVEQ